MSESPAPPASTPPVLVALRTKVGQHFEAATARSPGAIVCREGCHACCLPGLSVFELEAREIRAALEELESRSPETRGQIRAASKALNPSRCPMLVDGACAVYEARPMLCRTHGLPLLVQVDADAPVVDACALNYTRTDIPAASVLDVARVDEPLALLARLEAADARIDLRELAGE